MDPLKLLSRSTKRSKTNVTRQARNTPSSGQNALPQLFPAGDDPSTSTSRKRKRGQEVVENAPNLDFFGVAEVPTRTDNSDRSTRHVDNGSVGDEDAESDSRDEGVRAVAPAMPVADRKAVLQQHKLKVTWLNPPKTHKKDRRKSQDKESSSKKAEKIPLYSQPLQSFSELQNRYQLSNSIARNLQDQGYSIPTEVQLGAIPLLLEQPQDLLPSNDAIQSSSTSPNIDLLTVAPTGSGKTLAFAIPLLHRLLRTRRIANKPDRTTSAIILAPTKELAAQTVNECRKLAQKTGIKVTQVRKGMKFGRTQMPDAVERGEEEEDETEDDKSVVVKADIIVSTPGVLATILQEDKVTGHSTFVDVRNLILDEADVLLDQLFREQTLAIWNSLPHSDLQVSLWSATMGSNIEELARSIIDERRLRLNANGPVQIAESPLIRLVVGLKDSAVPNIEHKMVYSASEQGKLMGLRNLLHPSATTTDTPLLPPFLVFTQTIERAIALHSELLYDIPAEAGGIGRIAVLHSDLSDAARDNVMTKFRKGEIWVLITTDLLSRGVDFRGVNGVVNYDIPTSSAAYVHRVGRTGRAGRQGGIAVTLFSQEDIPYMKPIANLVKAAQNQRGLPATADAENMQKWLIDALPSVNKKVKHQLKKHGVESRTARGMKKDPKAARKAKISTKSGYLRREENKRRGAIMSSRNRLEAADDSDAGDETDFGGFE